MSAYRDEKSKMWYVKFRYTDWQGKSKHTTKRGFKTKKDALNYEHEFKATSEERVDITVASLAQKYLEDKKLHVKTGTFITLSNNIKNHILPHLGKLKLTELTPLIMREWQNSMIRKNLSLTSISNINHCCSSFLNFAVKFYGLRQNPLKLIGNVGKIESSINFWELSEFNQFIEVVKNPKLKICFLLLFYGGIRKGELIALNESDFDFLNNSISITKSMDFVTKEITTTKTPYSVRTIEMPEGIMQSVKNYINSLDEVTNPIFNMNNSTLPKAIKRYAQKAGVKEIRVHDLRHSHASLLIHSGVPITTISKRLGHKSPKITLDVYSPMYAETGKQTADILQEIYVSHSLVKS